MKKIKIVFSPFALDDVNEAEKWYNLQQKGLGKRFKEEVKDVVSSISLNPFFASVKYDNVRTAICKTFPYSVHYEIEESQNLIRITSIFHFSKEPVWLKKDRNIT